MSTAGIICEYNPLHLGHKKQIDLLRRQLGEEGTIVCLMSGNFVQRGAPAIMDKSLRARAAIASGADLVLELPVTYALSSAEGFARGGVEILSTVCDFLCFGAETADSDALMSTAKVLLSDEFPPLLHQQLETGKSFPAARAAALEKLGTDASILRRPNDILAVEYCKAILSTGTAMKPLPMVRQGDYHAQAPDPKNPSATALRRLLREDSRWEDYVPAAAVPLFASAPVHDLSAGQRAVLARLRTMTEEEFESLPYGSEGLWRKFMHACRRESGPEAITAATKSKRYTATRIDRMLMCAFLGISRDQLEAPAPYTRILAFNNTGRSVLKQAKQHTPLINAGEIPEDPYWDLERRCADLYGLFCLEAPEAPGAEEKQRVFYQK